MSSLSDKPSVRSTRMSWVILLIGLSVWLAVQGYLILMPVFSRSEPPEPKDTLPYIARTERMEKCFWGDCRALRDLSAQFSTPSPNKEVEAYRAWASTIFGSNQVGLSLILLVWKKAGIDVMAGYRLTCIPAVLLFGIGFAYLLTALWGRSVAGLALFLLAFKVFPDTGLNFIVPSNICMGLATLVLARIISRKGKALWTLGIGCPVLLAFHPIGAAYSLIAAALALALSGIIFSRRMLVTAVVVMSAIILAIILPTRIYNLSEYFSPVSIGQLLAQGGESFTKIIVEIVNLGDGLYGSLPLFSACLALGLLVATPDRRKTVLVFIKIYAIFLALSLFYPPRQPSDTFFRLWIPFIVVLYGAVGNAGKTSFMQGFELLKKFRDRSGETSQPYLQPYWPILVSAIIGGYAVQMSLSGAEQIIAMSEHFKNLWPIKVCSSQTAKLMAEAGPGDRVLYRSMMLMNTYFAKGALDLGAVYYHPVLKGTSTDTEWLPRPDVRFVVAFNPLAVHPSFEGSHERRWGVSCPEFRFSPLNASRRDGPILHENGLKLHRFKYIDVEWAKDGIPKSMTLILDNPESICSMYVSPLNSSGLPDQHRTVTVKISSASTKRIPCESERTSDIVHRSDNQERKAVVLEIDVTGMQPAEGLRLFFPTSSKSRAEIMGLRFDDSKLNWPWDHRARLMVADNSCGIGTMTFSFDPVRILPQKMQNSLVRVIDDCGSSVLLEVSHSGTSLK